MRFLPFHCQSHGCLFCRRPYSALVFFFFSFQFSIISSDVCRMVVFCDGNKWKNGRRWMSGWHCVYLEVGGVMTDHCVVMGRTKNTPSGPAGSRSFVACRRMWLHMWLWRRFRAQCLENWLEFARENRRLYIPTITIIIKKIPEENFLRTFFGSYASHSASNKLISSFVQVMAWFTFNSTSL